MKHVAMLALLAVAAAGPVEAQTARGPFTSDDVASLRSVADVRVSPDGRRIAYSVVSSDRPGRPYSRVWLMDTATGERTPLGADGAGASGPRWSPDGARIAYLGRAGDRRGIIVAQADGSGARFIAEVSGTNHPLPSSGERLAWSPDASRLAFISSTPGPEAAEAQGDPMVITRYLYKPTASEGSTRFNDNRRVHIFVANLADGSVRQLTEGDRYEHSIAWSPDGDAIAFVSNREADPDRHFNYDLFTVDASSGRVTRLTSTKSAEYHPRWSPDGRSIAFLGTTRDRTSSETTMEDTHVWVMAADGSGRRELGAAIDNRQRAADWSPDGRHVYTVVQERGSVRLYRLPVAGGAPELVVGDRGRVGAWTLSDAGALAYAYTTPASPAELYWREGRDGSPRGEPRRLTRLNDELLASREVAEVEAFTFDSFDGTPIEAFLTLPAGRTTDRRHPMIVQIHGGPHGQQGPTFSAKSQVYAARGWATLMVNYRGSTGYGQALADAIFGDQNGGEAKDVLAGVDAALARHGWIDPERLGVEGGSYGGQLANWIVTQTRRFRAAIPIASISNLISFNYMAYYHDYLPVEFGRYPHEDGLMDELWARSPLRYVHRVRTPVMLVHGENDNDVPIAEAEQFYVALHDVGVETVMVRYPREGHGIRETAHVIDLIDRSIAWYGRHFEEAEPTSARARR